MKSNTTFRPQQKIAILQQFCLFLFPDICVKIITENSRYKRQNGAEK